LVKAAGLGREGEGRRPFGAVAGCSPKPAVVRVCGTLTCQVADGILWAVTLTPRLLGVVDDPARLGPGVRFRSLKT